jgi:hypothetical protein
VTAILPNGRSRMRIVPTVALISEVNRLRTVITINTTRYASPRANNPGRSRHWPPRQTATARKLTEQVKSDKDLRKRLVEAMEPPRHAPHHQRVSKAAAVAGKHGKQIMAQLKRQRQWQIWNNITLASSLPFWAASANGSCSTHNLTLGPQRSAGCSAMSWSIVPQQVRVVKGGANSGLTAPVGNGVTIFFP